MFCTQFSQATVSLATSLAAIVCKGDLASMCRSYRASHFVNSTSRSQFTTTDPVDSSTATFNGSVLALYLTHTFHIDFWNLASTHVRSLILQLLTL